ncbi:MAG: SIS domain-containing protein [Clostridia bacterium]|nr:SIS domain-containing protein [Clostridia bacterium]
MSHTYQELKSQYEAMERTLTYVDERLPEITALLGGCDQLVFVGCGSSYTVAVSGALTAWLRLKKPALALPAGDLLLHTESYRPVLEGSAMVVLSRSGETSEVIRALERVQEMGVNHKVLGVACKEGSALANHSDCILEMPWAFDHSVCQTRTVSCLYLFCVYAAASLAGDKALLADLRSVVAGGPAFMNAHEATLQAVGQRDWTHAVVLGDGELAGMCDEGALAFKEICQVPSNAYHLLDTRHGPMVLIGKQTLVIAVLSCAQNKLELDMLRDLVAKGATVVAYSDEPIEIPGVVSVSFGQKLAHPARGLPAIAVCQLISYYKSFQTGANPDEPDGLSPWIVLG